MRQHFLFHYTAVIYIYGMYLYMIFADGLELTWEILKNLDFNLRYFTSKFMNVYNYILLLVGVVFSISTNFNSPRNIPYKHIKSRPTNSACHSAERMTVSFLSIAPTSDDQTSKQYLKFKIKSLTKIVKLFSQKKFLNCNREYGDQR